ncbi:MAG TPA: DSD1 family PLP-dependent enzyme [Burkholderiaceae bacterium]|nr:DSD1 family PLP-dependent enzyme [Burkholderiaceae bacterium]
MDWIPAQPGDAIHEIDTPALILDLDKFEANLKRMTDFAARARVRIRPHAKTHKCAEIARRQMDAGCAGICCQKLGEAEAMLAGDITDILITNQIVGERKMRRLARLARAYAPARLGVCVDNADVARQLASVCEAEEARVEVYVDVDLGQNRCGVGTAEQAIELARILVSSPTLEFMGLHAFSGLIQHRRGVPERREAADRAAVRASSMRDALLSANLPCDVVCGGGTGSFLYEAASGVFNELHAGSFALMDVNYARNEQDPAGPAFEFALFVLSCVMSLGIERATLDAGLKAFSTDSGPPRPTFAGWRVRAVTDEHTVMMRAEDGVPVKLGDKALLIPGRCDLTVNLHDWIVAIRKNTVEAVWPIDARGALY